MRHGPRCREARKLRHRRGHVRSAVHPDLASGGCRWRRRGHMQRRAFRGVPGGPPERPPSTAVTSCPVRGEADGRPPQAFRAGNPGQAREGVVARDAVPGLHGTGRERLLRAPGKLHVGACPAAARHAGKRGRRHFMEIATGRVAGAGNPNPAGNPSEVLRLSAPVRCPETENHTATRKPGERPPDDLSNPVALGLLFWISPPS